MNLPPPVLLPYRVALALSRAVASSLLPSPWDHFPRSPRARIWWHHARITG
ncbi:hypothetical protein I6G95_08500 [Corynebacterium amycolatum]|uniref:Uncharacterized protein n=1 Tax=Corynebacterium amycolatum TaxID=43765 RepID=A0AB37G8H6_CORAY|nr:hypothetical protein [Corynebacterium amycolatum]QPR30257.1 hypothetical protein I6G95_08500 [Corynebacterium amycolatum]